MKSRVEYFWIKSALIKRGIKPRNFSIYIRNLSKNYSSVSRRILRWGGDRNYLEWRTCSPLYHPSFCPSPNTSFTIFPVFFLDQQNRPFSGQSSTPVLVSYWLARWSFESQLVSFCPTGEPMGTDVHYSIFLLLLICIIRHFQLAKWNILLSN
jgi:hypothetical protein